jgi:AcrR family transcriptional regulator
MAAARRRRTYESPLRAEQVDRTREKLLDAGLEVVAEADAEEVTVRRVAARARVSVPTAYRYFPDRDALIEGIATYISTRITGTPMPSSSDELPEWVRAVFHAFDANDRLMRAQVNTAVGRTIRAKSQKIRNHAVVDLVKQSFPGSSPAAQKRLAALMRAIVNLHTWLMLHDDWGMHGEEAGELVTWALTTMLAEMRRRPSGLEFEHAAPTGAAHGKSSPRRSARSSTV